MKRTISFMTGKGFVNHNSRKFHAKNTDPERSYLNVEYCNEKIKDVYHELFDEALVRYNEKQTRSDRRIDDYYEKILSGKQEKAFHEIIVQIGDKGNMGAQTEDGQLAAKILDEYMQGFQQRNPTLRVFGAYLHMDEATPHLHIDFVPYTTGSRRGLEARVSLKQALSALGFKGGTRRETELNQWVAHEKEQLAAIMLEHGIEWEQKGTHEKHLSVLDFEKKERAKEVAELEAVKTELQEENAAYTEINEVLQGQLADMDDAIQVAQKQRIAAETEMETAEQKARVAKKKLASMTANIRQAEWYAAEYIHSPDEWLPEPTAFESAKSYWKRIFPLIDNLVTSLRSLYTKYLDLKNRNDLLSKRNIDLEGRIDRLHDALSKSESESEILYDRVTDLKRVRNVLGEKEVSHAIEVAKQQERIFAQQKTAKRKHSRDAR